MKPRTRLFAAVLMAGLACAPDDGASASPDSEGDALPEPEPIAWGRQLCDSCRMVIGASRHAAQAYSADGRLLSFDDPGCAVLEIAMGRVQPLQLFFRHVDQDRWLTVEQAGFVRREGTPMDFGYGAVEAHEAELTLDQVIAEMSERFGLEKP